MGGGCQSNNLYHKMLPSLFCLDVPRCLDWAILVSPRFYLNAGVEGQVVHTRFQLQELNTDSLASNPAPRLICHVLRQVLPVLAPVSLTVK